MLTHMLSFTQFTSSGKWVVTLFCLCAALYACVATHNLLYTVRKGITHTWSRFRTTCPLSMTHVRWDWEVNKRWGIPVLFTLTLLYRNVWMTQSSQWDVIYTFFKVRKVLLWELLCPSNPRENSYLTARDFFLPTHFLPPRSTVRWLCDCVAPAM